MSVSLLVAGGLLLAGAAIHGLVGDRFLRKIAPDALPPNTLGGPENSRSLVRVTWHFVTVTFALSGIALGYVSLAGSAHAAPGALAFLGLLYTSFAAFSVTAGILRHQHRFLIKHPAPLGLSTVAALICWNALNL